MMTIDATLAARFADEALAMEDSRPDRLAEDPSWQAALDWHLRLQAAPEDAALKRACAAWQAEDARHARAWRRLQRVWRLTGELPATQAVPDQPAAPVLRFPRRFQGRRAVWGGALAACLCLALLPLLIDGPGGDFSSPPGQVSELTLEDGSQVTLDGDSALASRFDDTGRRVQLLRGRAYFQVVADQGRPFTVEAGSSRVVVTGTAFNVRWNKRQLEVAVEHGSVEVADPGLGQRSVLKPGDRLQLDQADGNARRTRQPAAQMGAWRKGLLVANGTPLAELVEALESRQRGVILLDDEQLGRQQVTGVFDLNDPRQALQAMVAPHGGRIKTYGPWLTRISREP
ncbi:DUF4880 domain-containing protein [Pseudothauera nasutitermitis]|uniref:DUF4880 domain-containing protein n=1 Tax=Pseudothauera nasutitermitis TaxID=2565930 RepID=A0A4S4B312_9RHOO|nr:FecR domain-containing protein [Pseudothauera nasutitermitis]THF66969.1 DUF4880 domain-containing protein [Pseudothauera nasutitermitis]